MSDTEGHNDIQELRDLARRLQFELDGLNRRIERLESRHLLHKLATPTKPEQTPAPAIPLPPEFYIPESAPQPTPAPAFAAPPTEPTPAPPRIDPHPAPLPARNIEGVEARIGRVWMNRIGAIVLLLGVGFFVKYSFDQGLISPLARVLSAGATGLALIITGEVCLRRKMENFAVGLLGAGIAILYIASFGAYYFYHLIETNTAFVLLCGVTVLSTLIAIRGNLPAIAILGILGGFWTPIALSTGQNRQVELLTYILVLDIGFLLSALIRRWQLIRVLCWIGTLGLFGGWYLKYYDATALHRTLGFMVAFFAVFHADAYFWASRRGGSGARLIATFVHANNAIFFGGFYLLARSQYADWMGLFCVLTGALQWLTSWSIRRNVAEHSSVRMAFILDGATMFALAAPIQFDRYLVSMAWAAQSVVTFYFCRRIADSWLRVKAMAVLAAAVGHLIIFDLVDPRLTTPFWSFALLHLNWLILLCVGVGLSAYIAAGFLTARRAEVPADDRTIACLLLITGSALILGIFANQFERYIATDCWIALSLTWLLLSRRVPAVAWLAILLVFATDIKFLLWDTFGASITDSWANVRGIIINRLALTGLAAATLTCIAGRPFVQLLDVHQSKLGARDHFSPASFSPLLTLLTLFLITWTGVFEILRIFQLEPWRLRYPQPEYAQDIFITAFLTANAAALWLIFGLHRIPIAAYALVLTFITLIKFVFTDTISPMSMYRWQSLTGLLTNRTFIVGLAVIALGFLAYAYVRAAARRNIKTLGDPRLALAMLMLATGLSVWLPTFEILRAFQFEEFRHRFRDPKLAMHVALSVFWGVSAIVLLSVGFARRISALRYMAIALFGLTILKVFIVDLSHLQMVYRIVSFIALGVLLLLGSFLYQKLSSRILPRAHETPDPETP